ncbi:formate dehydrogenase-N subunit alpha [Providencia huaxiensis]|nr:formate dehydrogenase-N subunit alpha [Providencia huaxiensis]MDI7238541.1 formate dehydrogenase-N subunit alpha [Providencia huaxiensis]
MNVSRRKFFKICAGGMAGTTVAALGFMPGMAIANVREYKLLRSKETRNTCTYCSVGCGLLIYSMGDGAMNAKSAIFHVEGDSDHPVNRGALCPKGAGLLDYIQSENRLRYPEYRAPGSDKWERISWNDAFTRIARLMKDDRDANFIEKNVEGTTVNRWLSTGMLCASAASNETGMLTQKFARSLGMLAVDNQARVWHGPTVASLAPTFGRGAMTNHWVDIKNADVVVVMGGNAAEAHPVGFRWAIEAKNNNDATLIVIDPRFTRTASVADHYVPIRSGTDITFLSGVLLYLIENQKINAEYVQNYTNASLIVRDDFDFNDGLFSGYDADKRSYDKTSWNYKFDENGHALRDDTLQDPRCVWNLLHKHVSRYTPDIVEQICGTPKADFLKVCEILATTSAADKAGTFLYALGWTQHTVGAQNIRTMAMIQLLLGNMGVAGGGVNALRGHSNIQGLTDLGLLSTSLPGYLTLPSEKHQDIDSYLTANTPKATLPNQVNFWSNYPKFFVSLMKSFYGDSAQAENQWGYDWLPKWDQAYDVMKYFDMMSKNQVTGYICQGFNPVASFPDKNKVVSCLSKLKYLIVVDPLVTETANFWQNHGEMNDVDTASIQTEVFRLPSTCFAEEDGSIANSGRWLQWHWQAADAPGEARNDGQILTGILYKIRELYEKEGGQGQDPLMQMKWNYKQQFHPESEEVAKENNGVALADLYDADGNLQAKKGELLSSFALLRADGSTASSCWIYTGSWTEKGNQMANRDNSDPSGIGNTLGWAWAWPLNRRVIYNRASCDTQGKPWNKDRVLIEWNGKKWVGNDIPDFNASAPEVGTGPFIMQPEGLGRLFAIDKMAEGPFPEHYEPFETPLGTNPLHPNVVSNPAARIFDEDKKRLGDHKDFPYVGTTYRLTEHFHTWTKHARLNAIAQPEQFVEISETLAKAKGIALGDKVKVSSKRGFIKAVAVVTPRLQTLMVDGKPIETVGLPIHWGFEGATQKGFITNTLTPSVGDANSQTPEYKAFLVNIEKA